MAPFPELYQKSLGRPSKHSKKSTTPIHTQEENRSNDVLLDIGHDMDKLNDQEKIFYEDQKGMRKFRLSEEVDWEFEEERQRLVAEEEAEAEHQSNADAFMNPMDYEETFTTPVSTQSDRYTGRSTIAERLSSFVCKETPTPFHDMEYQLFPHLEIRRSRNVSPRVKDAITSVSHGCAISVPKACVA